MNTGDGKEERIDVLMTNGLNKERLAADQAHDWRWIGNGMEIPTQAYADQPFVIKTDDGALLCVLTTGVGDEGEAGQHVTSMRSTAGGRTWSEPVAVESPENPESSYAVLLKVPSGRIYCFYNYNEDNLREIETNLLGNPPTFRVDTLGYHVFKYSDDHGRSWSDKYYKIPIRETEIDRNNITGGKIRFMWNVGKPFVLNGAAYISIHKVGDFGEGFIVHSEGWLVRSDNLLTETDPEKITWETLPDGETGLTTPAGGGPIAEEQSYVVLSDDSIHATYRSIDGWLVESYSRDGGHTWSPPQYQCYADGRRMKQPRAACMAWKCSNGKYLQWFHNHGGRFIGEHGLDEPVKSPYEDRNPVWICAGIEVDEPEGMLLQWSPPEVLFYDDDVFIRMSYPDLIELDGELYITETQKDIARMHQVDRSFLDALWGQFDGRLDLAVSVLLEGVSGPAEMPMLELPRFLQRDVRRSDYGCVDLRQGFTLQVEVALDSLSGRGIILDSRTPSDCGWVLCYTENGALEWSMSDGQTASLNRSESGLVRAGERQVVTVIVDGGPRIVSYIVEGKFCDGGNERQFGWSRFSPSLRSAEGSAILRVMPGVEGFRIYDRVLMTCEAIALQAKPKEVAKVLNEKRCSPVGA